MERIIIIATLLISIAINVNALDRTQAVFGLTIDNQVRTDQGSQGDGTWPMWALIIMGLAKVHPFDKDTTDW